MVLSDQCSIFMIGIERMESGKRFSIKGDFVRTISNSFSVTEMFIDIVITEFVGTPVHKPLNRE